MKRILGEARNDTLQVVERTLCLAKNIGTTAYGLRSSRSSEYPAHPRFFLHLPHNVTGLSCRSWVPRTNFCPRFGDCRGQPEIPNETLSSVSHWKRWKTRWGHTITPSLFLASSAKNPHILQIFPHSSLRSPLIFSPHLNDKSTYRLLLLSH